MSNFSNGIFYRTLKNYKTKQLLYKFYYDILRRNEMSNYRYIDSHQDIKIKKLDLSKFCLIENP